MGIVLDDAAWAQIKRAAALVDSKEELERAITDPAAFVEKLVRLCADKLGPIALKYLVARVMPLLKKK